VSCGTNPFLTTLQYVPSNQVITASIGRSKSWQAPMPVGAKTLS